MEKVHMTVHLGLYSGLTEGTGIFTVNFKLKSHVIKGGHIAALETKGST